MESSALLSMGIENLANIKIGAIEQRSRVNGPGARFVIWVQGCSLACPQCINMRFADRNQGTTTTIAALAQKIISSTDIEGVTFSGGEPFQQPGPLSRLAKAIRATGLSVMSYTGYTLDELNRSNSPRVADLLENVDILVDGRFDVARARPLLWRGSDNQSIHLLTDRYREHNELDRPEALIELALNGTELRFTGHVSDSVLVAIKSRLREQYGIELS